MSRSSRKSLGVPKIIMFALCVIVAIDGEASRGWMLIQFDDISYVYGAIYAREWFAEGVI